MSNSKQLAQMGKTKASPKMDSSVKKAMSKNIDNTIKRISTSESKTKADIKHVVCMLLEYIPQTSDVGRLNRLLLAVNNPTRSLLVEFMKSHIGHKYDAERQLFADKHKGKTLTKCATNREKFGVDGDIWAWKKENTAERPPTDYRKRALVALNNAFDPTKGNLTANDMAALISESEFSLAEVMAEIDTLRQSTTS